MSKNYKPSMRVEIGRRLLLRLQSHLQQVVSHLVVVVVVVVFPSLAGSLLPVVEYDSKFKGKKGIVRVK